MPHRALIIIPTYNEIENLPRLYPRISAESNGREIHVLIVDDASKDGTADWVKKHPHYGHNLFMLERPSKLGLGTAYTTGFRWALERDYTEIFEMDADLSHDPREIPHFLAEIDNGSDLVLGSRYIQGVRVLNWPIGRLLLSLGAGLYVRILTGLPIQDPTGGYKCFRRTLLEKIDFSHVRSNGYSFQIELTHHAWMQGYTVREIPIVFEDRTEGTSKMAAHIAREAVWQVIRLALRVGLRRSPRYKKPAL